MPSRQALGQTAVNGHLSPVVQALPPSGIRAFFDLAARSTGVISLGVGEPELPTPEPIRQAAVRALEQGSYTGYTSNLGLPALRQAVARYLKRWLGLDYDPDREILITAGVAEGIDLALRALVTPGDDVLVPEPCFVSYPACTTLAGGRVVWVPLRPDNGFRLTPEELEQAATPRSRLLLFGYPHNPTGAVMGREELEAVARLVEDRDLFVVSDEIYGELTYGRPHVSFASLPGMRERTVRLGGLSKGYAMTGWRVGYACGPAPVIDAMNRIHQYTLLCAPTLSQIAAIEALERGSAALEAMRATYERQQRRILEALGSMGLPCSKPGGAFYVFPDVGPTGLSGEAFARRLLEEERVAVVPGRAFGPSGEGFVRMSYAVSPQRLEEALERIGRFVGRLSRSR